MRLTEIVMDGIKGRSARIPVESRNLLLQGEMGSGKSAVIDAVHLALMLPTRFGSTHLDRLSPNGDWSVSLRFDSRMPEHAGVHSLTRSFKRNKTALLVNGLRVDQTEYEASIRTFLQVEPHHVDLQAFLQLSGSKRAEMFAVMLEGNDLATPAQILHDEAKQTVEEFLRNEVGVDRMNLLGDLVGRLGDMKGTAPKLTESLRTLANEVAQDERDAKTRLEGLVGQQVAVTHGMNAVELRAKIQALDEQLGGFKQRKDNIDRETERFDHATKAFQETQKVLEQAKGNMESVSQTFGQVEDRRRALEEHVTRLNAHRQDCQQLNAEKDRLVEQLAALSAEQDRLRRAKALLDDLLSQPWSVDPTWLLETGQEMLDKLGLPSNPIPLDKQDVLLAFAREVIAEVLGGDSVKLAEKLESVISRTTAQSELTDAQQETCAELSSRTSAWEKAVEDARAALTLAEQAGEKLPQLTQQIVDLEQTIGQMSASTQRTAVADDAESLAAQIEAANTQRKELNRALRELDESNAISGQVEGQRVVVARTTVVAQCVKRLAELAQRWRDAKVRERLTKVMTPFQESFSLLFGTDMEIKHYSAGQGRSTEFEFQMGGKGWGRQNVPLDLLSDGEMILTAAAFLTALQRIKPGPGTILTLNSEPVSVWGLDRLLMAIPELGLDCVIVSNNHADADPSTYKALNWQAVSMRREG